ncbi:uncharacterized protein LOC135486582 [Lineus longissimus]|uniref:uncharacterized protein LOC135486582 n=1 Tax=Lineus longissimus TaxID=88925 RepID=UPI00315C850D
MVQRRSQKRKVAEDDNIRTTASENRVANGDPLLSPPSQKSNMAVFDFKSPSSEPSIDDSSSTISSVSFYKTSKTQPMKNFLTATENTARDDKSYGETPSKRLKPSYLSNEVISSLTKSNLGLVPRSAKTPNTRSSKGVKDWSPMRADDVIHASTPGDRKKSPGLTNINDIVSAVTSDSPVRKVGSDTSDSENDENLAEVAMKLTRKELFCARSPAGKYSSKFYSKILSPKTRSPRKRTSFTPDVISGKRFFKHRKCLSESKDGKRASVSVGRGFDLKFTPHGRKQNDSKKKQRKGTSVGKAPRTSRFSKLEFTSDSTKSGEEIVRINCTGESCWEGPLPPTEPSAEVSEANKSVNGENLSENNESVSASPHLSESEHVSQYSMDLFSSNASSKSGNPIDLILEGFGFDEEDAECSVSSPMATEEDTTQEVSDQVSDVKSATTVEVDDGWSTQSVASSSDQSVSSTAHSGNDLVDGTPSQKKLFPVFTRSPKQSPKEQGKSSSVKGSSTSPRSVKNRLRDIKAGLEQYSLDFGQKGLGTTQCGTCGMVYSMKEPTDEAHHSKFHQRMLTALKFPKIKEKSVVQEFPNGSCIIQISPDDDKTTQKKVDAIMALVDEDLGFLEVVKREMDHKKTFLYISEQKRVIGCCVAEAITQAYPVLADSQRSTQLTDPEQQRAWCCSTKSVSAKCGVSRIWVFRNERRKGIATQLLDCVRYCFFLGSPLEKSELAFTDPTPDGRGFATNFSGVPHFLVYK